MLSIVLQGCEKDNNDIFTENKYKVLEKRYNIRNLDNPESVNSITTSLKPIKSPEELEKILEMISSNFTIVDKTPICNDFNIQSSPRLKSTGNESTSNTVRITGVNSNGRTDVFLDTSTPSVVNSRFYNTGIFDAFIGYNHISGSASGSNSQINFTAYGEIIVKIIWEGVELKRIPVACSGYYNINSKTGVLTSF
ncbi:MAG TPA: hypothetical protein VLZ83_07550 [Edaphocola sp.]|nr:hypothetical protein [Edaphocola sp.]